MTLKSWFVALVGSLAMFAFLSTIQDRGFLLPDQDVPQDYFQPVRDVEVVWIVERAVFAGLDPSTPIPQLAEDVGTPLPRRSILRVHPRPPSGYLLEGWVALLPSGWVNASGLVITALGFGVLLGLTGVIRGSPVPLALFPLLLITDAFDSLVFWRSTSWMVGISILGCWALARKRDTPWAGLALVPAIGTRVFPLVFVPFLWLHGRRKAAVAAVVGSLVLNLAGLALPNVSIASTLRVLAEDKQSFLASWGNGSLWATVIRPGGSVLLAFVVAALVVGGAFWFTKHWRFDKAFGLVLVASLLATPIAWSHFRLSLLPVAIGPLGLGIWAIEVFGRVFFEWRWIAGILSVLAAGVVWLRATNAHTVVLPDPLPAAVGEPEPISDSRFQ